MGEKRLIEITTEICRTDDPIWVMYYVASLGESDINLLFKYIKSSKYSGCNVYDSLYKFSCDYLLSKGVIVTAKHADFLTNSFSDSETSLEAQSTYFANMLAGDDSIKFVGTGKGR